MIVADVLSIFFILLGLMLAVPAFFLVSRSLFPAHAQRMDRSLNERPVATFFTGAGVAFGMAIVIGIMGALPLQLFKVLALWGFGVCLGYGLMGGGSLGSLIGTRLGSSATPAWKSTLFGGLALALSCLIPILGWFVMLPGMLLAGVGANTMAIFGARAAKPPAVPASPIMAAAAAPVAPVRERIESSEPATPVGV